MYDPPIEPPEAGMEEYRETIYQWRKFKNALETIDNNINSTSLPTYDGGVAWWQDYIRAELGRIQDIVRDALS